MNGLHGALTVVFTWEGKGNLMIWEEDLNKN